jgi:hypothetical protein
MVVCVLEGLNMPVKTGSAVGSGVDSKSILSNISFDMMHLCVLYCIGILNVLLVIIFIIWEFLE